MTSAALVWTLMLLWMSVSSEVRKQEQLRVLYPEILSSVFIECDGSKNSDSIYWFRTSAKHNRVQFLMRSNNANRLYHGQNVDKSRFKINKRGSAFVLRIINVTEDDAGVYSCILKDLMVEEVWNLGTLLLPGAVRPTPPSTSKPGPAVNSDCKCGRPNSSSGCSSLTLYSLVALLSVLTLAIVCTLYYFSRLPRKCRHHFVKKKFGS